MVEVLVMYYEEKVIKGVLHFRTSPHGFWEPIPPERLTEMLVEARKERMRFQQMVEDLSDEVYDFLERT